MRGMLAGKLLVLFEQMIALGDIALRTQAHQWFIEVPMKDQKKSTLAQGHPFHFFKESIQHWSVGRELFLS